MGAGIYPGAGFCHVEECPDQPRGGLPVRSIRSAPSLRRQMVQWAATPC